MASGGPAPLARMYREQLGRRARPVGTVGLLPELNGFSFETEEYNIINKATAHVAHDDYPDVCPLFDTARLVFSD